MAEQWTVKGRVVVDHVLPELVEMLGSRTGIGGIQVKVSARSKIPGGWGTWNSWGTVRTGQDGRFDVREDKGSDRRQFKVQILFDSARLRVREGKESSVRLDSTGFPIDIDLDLTDKDWHEIHNDKDDDTERRAGVHDLGDIRVKGPVVPRHADIWMLYGKAIDLMASYGPAFAFADKVHVKYPMTISPDGSSSYWNPVTKHGYIKDGQCNAYTLLHELSHQWEYDHCTGETSMVWQLAKHGSTHQPRESTTYVPFLESFADWAAVRMLQEMSAGALDNFLQVPPYARPNHPFSRSYIGADLATQERNLANLDYTERGWYGLFAVLTFAYLDRIDVDRPYTDVAGTDTRYAFLSIFGDLSDLRVGLSFKDVLSVFLRHPQKSLDGFLRTGDMNFRDFLNRAAVILPVLDDGTIRSVKALLDPRTVMDRAGDAPPALPASRHDARPLSPG